MARHKRKQDDYPRVLHIEYVPDGKPGEELFKLTSDMVGKTNSEPFAGFPVGYLYCRKVTYYADANVFMIRCECVGVFTRLLLERGEKPNQQIDFVKRLTRNGTFAIRHEGTPGSVQQTSVTP